MTFLGQVPYALVVAAFGSLAPFTAVRAPMLPSAHLDPRSPGSVCTDVVLEKSLQNTVFY